MPYDAFTRFPRRFTSRASLAKKIYRSLRNSMGPAFDQASDSRVQAKLYATAMGMAHALRTLERVKKNSIALSATDLLSNMESIYGLIPGTKATFRERRQALHARMLLSRGSRPEAVQSILIAILGADFEEWLFATADTLIRYPDTSAEAEAVGNYVPAGSSARVLRLQESCFPGSQTVAVEELTAADGDTTGLVGRKILVDPSSRSRRETVTISAVTTDSSGKVTSVTATFAGVHDPGVLMTTQYFPTWTSNAHQHAFRLSDAAAVDGSQRRRANEELLRVMKGIATWGLTTPGPFYPDTSLVGVTEIGDADEPAEGLIEIFGDRLVAYWGASVDGFHVDLSGNANDLTYEGATPTPVVIDGSMGGILLESGVEMSCDDLASIASGTDQPFSVFFWGEWVSGEIEVFQFQHSSGSAVHKFEARAIPALYAGVRRIDDAAGSSSSLLTELTTSQRFFGHTFNAAGDTAVNRTHVDETTGTGSLAVNPTTFDQFRLAPAATGSFRVARMIVLNDSVTGAEATQLRELWEAQASWNS